MSTIGWENPLKELDWSVPGGQMPIRQPCPRCGDGQYGWVAALRSHLNRRHPDLSPRQRSEATAEALRRSRYDARVAQESSWSPR